MVAGEKLLALGRPFFVQIHPEPRLLGLEQNRVPFRAEGVLHDRCGLVLQDLGRGVPLVLEGQQVNTVGPVVTDALRAEQGVTITPHGGVVEGLPLFTADVERGVDDSAAGRTDHEVAVTPGHLLGGHAVADVQVPVRGDRPVAGCLFLTQRKAPLLVGRTLGCVQRHGHHLRWLPRAQGGDVPEPLTVDHRIGQDLVLACGDGFDGLVRELLDVLFRVL